MDSKAQYYTLLKTVLLIAFALTLAACHGMIGANGISRLNDVPEIKRYNISIDEVSGHVRVAGSVPNAEIKSEILTLVLQTPGVRSVSNQLRVEERTRVRDHEEIASIGLIKEFQQESPEILLSSSP